MTEQLHFYFTLSFIGEGNGNPLQYSCLENPRVVIYFLPSLLDLFTSFHLFHFPLLLTLIQKEAYVCHSEWAVISLRIC